MQPWLYALLFIALMMAVGWAVDRHVSRSRRSLRRLPVVARAAAPDAARGLVPPPGMRTHRGQPGQRPGRRPGA